MQQRSLRNPPYKLAVVPTKKILAKQQFGNDQFLIANKLDDDGALPFKVIDPSGTPQRGVISKKELKEQFGKEGYNKFQEVLGVLVPT